MSRRTRIAAWAFTLTLSWLPDILLHELTGVVPSWLHWAKIGLALFFIALSYFWYELSLLRSYAIAFGMVFVSLEVYAWLYRMPWFQRLLNASTSYSVRELAKELPELTFPLIMLATLFLLHRDRRKFFFARGDAGVETEPVPLPLFRPGMSVRSFAGTYALIIAIIVTLGLGLRLQPSWSMMREALPLLPIILLTALVSSFGEEVLFRASLISVSHQVVGKHHSLWMAAFVFGSGHYLGGQPNLLFGAVITGVLGWGLGKIMLESRSLLLPWMAHFAINAIVFTFNEMGVSLTM